MFMKYIYATIFGLVSTVFIACSVETSANTDDAIKTKMLHLDKRTKKLIGSASCSSDNQCHSIGFGHKPCGGFYSYRIYSDQNTNVTQLKNQIKQYNELTREQNKKGNLVSDCMMLMPPQLTCRKQTCQIK